MECPVNLEICKTYCNEGQIFPAMRYFIEELQMSVNGAAKEVSKITHGLVTEGRAKQVWLRRAGGTNVPQQPEPIQEVEEIQEVDSECYLVENPKENIIESYKEELREKRAELKQRHEEKRTQPLPQNTYRVIYADPPWSFDNSGINIAAEKQYQTMSLKEICDLKVNELSDSTTVLFLWAVASQIPEAIEVSKSWGFPNIKTCMVWVKNKSSFGGWWLRTRHEILFICTKNETPQPAIKVDSVIESEVGKHSSKPEIFYNIIEQMYNPPYIELFSRNKRSGWEMWGNEIE